MGAPVEVFFSYAHEDEKWRQELEKHLSMLKRSDLITAWHDREILAGKEWAQEIDRHLNTAHLILLLISPDFMASDYCWGVELQRAMERHHAGEARVIPILIRPVSWKGAPFGALQALPANNSPVASWLHPDDAFLQVAEGIRKAVEEVHRQNGANPSSSFPLWNLPYDRNPFFTGREEVLKRLHDTLRAGKTTALTQPQAISGLGGIGKTQTAVEYAYRYQDDYDAILWIKADAYETLMLDFITMAHLLNLPERNEQDQHLIVEAVKRWFQNHSRWLLIFDNADDLTLTRGFLPSGGKGHILLTTRTQVMGSMAQRIELAVMNVEEGALFLLHRATILDPGDPLDAAAMTNQVTAREIVQALDGLPLALDQAGAYMEETQCGLSGYLQLYRTRQAELLKRRGKMVSDHPEPVAATWSLSFENVQHANPAAADLLRLCAFLDPESIPEEIITVGAPELGPALNALTAEPIALNEAMGVLLTYSLVRRNPDQTLTLHRLVQAVLKHRMNKSTQRRWAERAVRAVNLAFPAVAYDTWLQCQHYLPHAQVCVALIDDWDMSFPEAAALLMQTASYLKDRAQYIQAEPLFQRALAIREKMQGPEHPDTAATLNNLALLYWARGKYEQAEPLFQRALAIYERALGPEHPYIVTIIENYSMLLSEMKREAEARELEMRGEAIRRIKWTHLSGETVKLGVF
jgi:tetratricopeptide (TPR) repeat protein